MTEFASFNVWGSRFSSMYSPVRTRTYKHYKSSSLKNNSRVTTTIVLQLSYINAKFSL